MTSTDFLIQVQELLAQRGYNAFKTYVEFDTHLGVEYGVVIYNMNNLDRDPLFCVDGASPRQVVERLEQEIEDFEQIKRIHIKDKP